MYIFHLYRNKWEECSLYSNILWLKYLCKKMKEFKYSHPTAVTHKRGLKTIDSFNTQLMKCRCALDCLERCGITKTAFKKSISDTPRRSILVSRNSIQKSKLSICNWIELSCIMYYICLKMLLFHHFCLLMNTLLTIPVFMYVENIILISNFNQKVL